MTLTILSGLIGLCAGSFLNVCIHRIPLGQTPWNPPRSYCPSCKAPVRAVHNIPLFSYLFLRGRCADCSARIPLRYPLVELAAAALFAWAAWAEGPTPAGARAALFGALLLALGVIDWRTERLPDVLTGIGAALALIFAAAESALAGAWKPLADAGMAGAVGFGSLWLIRAVANLAYRKEAMGFGDVKLIGMIGLFLGSWSLALLTISLSAVIGSVGGLAVIRIRGRKQIPYGVFLGTAAWISGRWGVPLLDWYFSLWGG